MVVVRHLVRGGAERLLSGILRHLGGEGVRLLVVKTGLTPPGYEAERAWFEGIAAEQVCLPERGDRRHWARLVGDLVAERGVTAIAISDTDDGYRLLPAVRARAPTLWVSDLQYNPLAQVENNRSFGSFIDVTIAQSRRAADAVIAAGAAPERVLLNPGGIDLAAFVPDAAARDRARERLGIAKSSFVVGYLARFDETKNPPGFVEVARRRPDPGWTYLLGGSGPLDADVDHALRELPPGADLRRLGQVRDARSFLELIDVLVSTSLNEGRPLAIMEAAAMGRPTVATAVGGVPELVDHGVTGFLSLPGDPDAIARHLDWLAAHPAERVEMGRNARARALGDFDLSRSLQRYAAALLGP